MKTLFLNAKNNNELCKAAEILKSGGLVALPTETVYGLGANALDAQAVENIFKAKGRPQDNPLIVHIGKIEDMEKYGYVNPIAQKLAQAFMPGPLTIIVKKREVIPFVVSAGLDSVGIRMPNHPVALELLNKSGVPVAAPSANTSGKPSPTRALDVLEDMDGKIEAVLEGGDCQIGVESTVVDTTGEKAVILRPGAVTIDMMAEILGEENVLRVSKTQVEKDEAPKAPGMKYRHYAPKAQVHLYCGSPFATYEEIKKNCRENDGVLCFSEFLEQFDKTIDFGMSYDKKAHTHKLFSAFRDFDKMGVDRIFVQCPREYGEDVATVNRLRKASCGNIHIVESQEIIGITGRSGSGKSYISKKISQNHLLIDCDKLYGEMLFEDNPLTRELGENYPRAVDKRGICRKILSQIVYEDKEQIHKINTITHKHIIEEILKICKNSQDNKVFVDAPTLFESNLDIHCTKIIGVISDEESSISRIIARDGISKEQAENRLKLQKNNDFFLMACDEIIYNK